MRFRVHIENAWLKDAKRRYRIGARILQRVVLIGDPCNGNIDIDNDLPIMSGF